NEEGPRISLEVEEGDQIATLLSYRHDRLGGGGADLGVVGLQHLRRDHARLRILDVYIEPFRREVAEAFGHGVEKHLLADAYDRVHLHKRHLLEGWAATSVACVPDAPVATVSASVTWQSRVSMYGLRA